MTILTGPVGSEIDEARIEIGNRSMGWKQSARLRAEGIWTQGQRADWLILVDKADAATSQSATA